MIEIAKNNRFKIIYIHLIRLFPYAKHIKQGYKIVDFTDCISLEYERSLGHRKGLNKIFYSIEAYKTSKYEHKVKLLADENWVISQVDFQSLGLETLTNSYVIPNPVNICEDAKDYELKNKLVFVGNMSVPHNIYAATYVAKILMPKLLSDFPQLSFHIIGANPIASVQELTDHSHIFVHGYVPNLYHELLNCDIFVAPMFFCAGIQNKVLEAMACGVPVLTTSAVRDSIGCQDKQELLIANDENDFYRNIVALLTSRDLRETLGKTGKKFIAEKYSLASVSASIKNRLSNIK